MGVAADTKKWTYLRFFAHRIARAHSLLPKPAFYGHLAAMCCTYGPSDARIQLHANGTCTMRFFALVNRLERYLDPESLPYHSEPNPGRVTSESG